MKRLLVGLALLLIPVQSLAFTTNDNQALDYDAPRYGTGGHRVSCNAGELVTTNGVIPKATVDAIQRLQSTYQEAATARHLPWQLLAAIDYEENSNDPDRSMLAGEPIGSRNPDHPGLVTTSKLDSIYKAIDNFTGLAHSNYGVVFPDASNNKTLSSDEIKQIIISHNRGNAYKRANTPPDASPYVMEKFDPAHTGMRFPNIPGETLAGRTWAKLGAFTLFTRLGGAVVGTACGGSNGIVEIATAQIGRKEDPPGSNGGPQIQIFLGSSKGEEWCADFVSWVYREAGHPLTGGLDGGWRIAGVFALEIWFRHNGEYHEQGDPDNPRPGDVVIFGPGKHTGIVTGLQGDTLVTIEGNHGGAVGRVEYPNFRANGYIAGWGRLKEGG